MFFAAWMFRVEREMNSESPTLEKVRVRPRQSKTLWLVLFAVLFPLVFLLVYVFFSRSVFHFTAGTADWTALIIGVTIGLITLMQLPLRSAVRILIGSVYVPLQILACAYATLILVCIGYDNCL